MWRSCLIVWLLPPALCGNLAAQQVAENLIGEPVRVHNAVMQLEPNLLAYSTMARIGNLIEVRGDTLFIAAIDTGEAQRLVLQGHSTLERRGLVPAGGRGAAIGALVGGLAGAAVGYATYEQQFVSGCNLGEVIGLALAGARCPRPDKPLGSRGSRTAGAAVLGVLVGAGLGRLIGQAYKTDGWVPVAREELKLGLDLFNTSDRWEPSVQLRF